MEENSYTEKDLQRQREEELLNEDHEIGGIDAATGDPLHAIEEEDNFNLGLRYIVPAMVSNKITITPAPIHPQNVMATFYRMTGGGTEDEDNKPPRVTNRQMEERKFSSRKLAKIFEHQAEESLDEPTVESFDEDTIEF